jgi:malto-oligosyltrehalose trehalohydrolase
LSRRTIRREQEMKFGTQMTSDGVRFRLWAPLVSSVELEVDGQSSPMRQGVRGWHEIEVPGIDHGSRYMFRLPDGKLVPDPASRYQPEDVDGPSEVIDPLAFEWTDLGWRGRPWEECVFYEVHIGTFTLEGTFRAAADKLDHLADLGITALQIMPLADFAGRWNWGYDGVSLFAPDSSYGRPEDLKALINSAHALGMMVMLDVVYNHFGPKGNYIPLYAPILNDKETPWGRGLNVDGDNAIVVRDMVLANARFWINEYRFDGLRFDALHAIEDSGPKHLIQDLAEQTRAASDGRHIHLVAENSLNQARWLRRRNDGTAWLYTAQWNDDLHHGLHALVTGEGHWYYQPFVKRIDLVARALAEGFAWQGEYLAKENRIHGEPSTFLPPTAFVSFIQNHDHAGNRPAGERIGHLVPREAARMLAALYLLSPQIPMLFMGEEWGASTPFCFFSDIQELSDVVRKGRAEELKDFPEAMRARHIDPASEEAFHACKLNWSERSSPAAAEMLALYETLLHLRASVLTPRLVGMSGDSGSCEILGPEAFQVHWKLGDGSTLNLAANLGASPQTGEWRAITPLWCEGTFTEDALGAYTALFWLT